MQPNVRLLVQEAVTAFEPESRRGRTEGYPDLFPCEAWDRMAIRHALTPKEKLIARLICKGLEDKSIASVLGIRYPTLVSHRRALYAKIGCHDRVELILLLVHDYRRTAALAILPMTHFQDWESP